MATKKTLEYDLVNDKAEYETLPMKAGDTGEYVKLADKDSSGGASTNAPSGIVGTKTNTGTTAAGNGTKTTSAQVAYPDVPEYQKYTYNKYAPSETVQQADAALKAIQAAQPGAYQSKWQSQVDSIINQILNREKFSYDFNEDALYKQYAEQYTRGGKLAMQDTMGQASAMTGGYGSSYASTAGNQAYQEYLSKLNEVIPELYGMALDRYQMEGQEMYNQYGLLSSQEQQDYARYMDSYNQWLNERDYATGRYDTAYDRDYNAYLNDVNLGYQIHSDEQDRIWNEYVTANNNAQFDAEFGEKVKQNEISNQQWQQSFDEGVRQYNETMAFNEKTHADTVAQWGIENGFTQQQIDEMIKQNGIENVFTQMQIEEQIKQNGIQNGFTQQQIDEQINQNRIQNGYTERELGMKEEEHAAAMDAYKREEESDADSKKLYSGNGYNNGTLTVGQIKELQAYYGVEADGLYGPKTQAATGGLSADEAYANIFGGTSETKKLTASEIKGVSSEVAARVADGGINAAEGYLDVMVSSGLLAEEEAKMILAPYVTVDEDEIVDTTVPTTSTVPGLGTSSNSSGSTTAPSDIGLNTIQKNAMDATEEYMKKILGIK